MRAPEHRNPSQSLLGPILAYAPGISPRRYPDGIAASHATSEVFEHLGVA